MDIKNLLSRLFNNTPSNISSTDYQTFLDGYHITHGIVLLTFKRSGFFVMLPENFSVDEHVVRFLPESYGFTTRLGKFDKNKVYYLLGLLSSIPSRNKDLIVDDGYIPINAEILNSFMTDYNSYLRYLRDTGIIEWKDDGGYFEGKSRRYRWTEQYITSKFVRVEMPKFSMLSEQKKRVTVEEFLKHDSERNKALIKYQYLTYWYNQNKLKFDVEKAENYALLLRDYKLAKGVESWDWNKDKDRYKHPSNQYAAILENLHSISFCNDYKVLIDKHVHRFHSVLTNMQKEFRNFLTYDGQQLVSIDIKNSQPYLSCVLFNSEFWSENSTLNLNLNQLPQNIIASIRFTPPKETATPITTALSSFFKGLEGHEFDTYKNIVSSGNMYETIMGWIQEERGQIISRNDAKTTMFRLFFSPNKENREDENHWLMTYYKNKFPQVAALFKIIKKQYQGSDEDKQHGRLACLLQSIESEIILHRCCKRIWDEKNHQVPVFTIHDSISTTIEHKNYVKNVMQEELTRAIGLPPRLSEEVWKEEALELQLDAIRHYLEVSNHLQHDSHILQNNAPV